MANLTKLFGITYLVGNIEFRFFYLMGLWLSKLLGRGGQSNYCLLLWAVKYFFIHEMGIPKSTKTRRRLPLSKCH